MVFASIYINLGESFWSQKNYINYMHKLTILC
jgi:hypothetical protein